MSAGTAILFSMFSTSYMAHTNAVKFYNELQVGLLSCRVSSGGPIHGLTLPSAHAHARTPHSF